jgi:Resolvase, N terminal domain/Helix-turn-helix domain of resolvase
MMGRKERTQAQIAALTLDELVPTDHFYRHLERALDLSFVRDFVQGCYAADKGRPSIDPLVFFRSTSSCSLKASAPSGSSCVWRLDRLGRSLKHLIETVTILHDRGIGYISLTEHIDTTTSSGKLIFHIFAALAEFERDVIRERTQAGLQAARARGRLGGRPRLLAGAKKLAMVQAMYDDKSNTIEDICEALHISRATLYRYLKANRATTEAAPQSDNQGLSE